MTHLYAIETEILDFLDERPNADTTAIRRHLAYTADVSITYDALEPHLERLEQQGCVDATRSAGAATTYYSLAEAAPVQPKTASD